jgi:hypothetical protein
MTTIAAKFSTGEIAADSMVSGDDAVEVACLYDSSSHGPIDEIKLPRKPRGVKKSI